MNTLKDNQNNSINYKGEEYSDLAILHSIYRDSIYHVWNIKHLKNLGIIDAFLLNWKPNYLLAQLKNDQNSITYNNKAYDVKMYPNHKYTDILSSKKACLSFREYEGIRVVMIKLIF